MREAKQINIEEILSIIEQTLVSAPVSFEAVANGPVEGVDWGADRMPESWIIALLMQAIHRHGLTALPEVRIKHDAQYFEFRGRHLSPEDFPVLAKGGAKIDLFIGEQSPLPNLIRLRMALEVKGPKSTWQQFRGDLERLREIRKVVNGKDQAAVFAYLTCPLLKEEREQHDRKLEDSTGLKLPDFKVLSALRNSVYPNRLVLAYIHVIH